MMDLGTFPISDDGSAPEVIVINTETTKQKLIGFGVALTEAAGYNFAKLSDSEKKRAIDALYSADGLNLQVGRTHIGSADFSLSEYQYISKTDNDLSTWDFSREGEFVLPLVKAALAKNPNLWLFCSPWSPPAQWKSNGRLNWGGTLLPERYEIYARYLARYITSYRDLGVTFQALTIQNEAASMPLSWESCDWTAEQEGGFAVTNLRTALIDAGLPDVKIMWWDFTRDQLRNYAYRIMQVPGASEVLWGCGVHYYAGDFWDQMDFVKTEFPDQHMAATELCRGDGFGTGDEEGRPESNWYDCAAYAHEYIGDLLHGAEFVCDWNALINEECGPFHNRLSGVKAPLVIDTNTSRFHVGYIYNAVAHFSRFMLREGVVCEVRYTGEALEAASVKNPDGSVAVVVLNQKEAATRVRVEVAPDQAAVYDVPAQSLFTVVFR